MVGETDAGKHNEVPIEQTTGNDTNPNPAKEHTRDLTEPTSKKARIDLDACIPEHAADADTSDLSSPLEKADSTTGPVSGFTKADLPPPKKPYEIEFIIPNASNFSISESVRSELCQPSPKLPFRFRLYVFPLGTAFANQDAISAFVEVEPMMDGIDGLGPIDIRWQFPSVAYSITVVNWNDYRTSVTKENTWTFTVVDHDRGWHEFVPQEQFTDREKGWLGPNGELCLRATAICSRAEGVDTGDAYLSKKETGYIGLKNHGATCYMNTLLQSLFLLGKFRELVYSLDFDGNETAGKESEDEENMSVAQALQEVFYKMQTSDTAQPTKRLMKSFGWDSLEAFTQHDAQELNRLLCDRLEIHIQNSPDGKHKKGVIKEMFEGQMTNYIECMDCDYKSERTEPFWDIQLNIKGQRGEMLKNVDESFKDFVSEEILEGDNAYDAGPELGKQRARKGIRFQKFPPILNLQLKRFQFDMGGGMVKLNDRYEFSEKLDISTYDPSSSHSTYELHSVVVHRGDVHAGHYYVHCRPHIKGRWLKFDDDIVTHCSSYAAMEDNFGGEDPIITNYFGNAQTRVQSQLSRSRIHSAYMLVYLRSDVCEELIRPPDPQVVNPKMVLRCGRRAQELEEKRRKKLERLHKISVQVLFEPDLQKLDGFWDHTKVLDPANSSQILKFWDRDKTTKDLLHQISQHPVIAGAGIPITHLAIFFLEYRTQPAEVARQVRFAHAALSKPIRAMVPTFALPHYDPLEPVFCCLVLNSLKYDIQRGVVNEGAENILKNWQEDNHIMLIIKYFCCKTCKIVTLGAWHEFVGRSMKESLISWAILRLKTAGFNIAKMDWEAPSTTWRAWEEFGAKDIQERQLSPKVSARDEGLWTGDVLILQSFAAGEVGERVSPPTFPISPVMTVFEHSQNLANELEINVIVHDPLERLSDESDDDADSNKRIAKLDKRWTVHYTSAVIAKTIDETAEVKEEKTPSYWLFFIAPNKQWMPPLNLSARDTPTIGSYVDSQFRHADDDTLGPKMKPTFHVVANPLKGKTKRPFCVRIFSDHVVEIKCVIVYLECNNSEVAAEAIVEQVGMDCDFPNPWRMLRMESGEGRIKRIFRSGDAVPCPSLTNEKANIYRDYLRLESDEDANSGPLVEFMHADAPRLSLGGETLRFYGQPVLFPVPPTEVFSATKKRLAKKLLVPDAEIRRWRFTCGNSIVRDETTFIPGYPVYMLHERIKREARCTRALTMKR